MQHLPGTQNYFGAGIASHPKAVIDTDELALRKAAALEALIADMESTEEE